MWGLWCLLLVIIWLVLLLLVHDLLPLLLVLLIWERIPGGAVCLRNPQKTAPYNCLTG